MQMGYRIRSKHTYRYLLRDDGLAVASTEFVVEGGIEAVFIVVAVLIVVVVLIGRSSREGAIRVRGRGSGDGKSEHGQVVLLGEAYLGRRGIEGRFEGAVQRRERNFEVDDIICSRLHADALKDGVLRGALTSTRPRRDNMLTIESTLHLVRTSDTKIRSVYLRPYLRALLWYDGEAYLLLAELHPRERAERIERRCKL